MPVANWHAYEQMSQAEYCKVRNSTGSTLLVGPDQLSDAAELNMATARHAFVPL